MKLLIVDDHGLVREGLKAILAQSDLQAQCLEAWDEASIWHELNQHPDIDMVLLDIQLPGLSGIDLLQRIVKDKPQLPIIMLSADHDSSTVSRTLELGASGFLPKSSLNQVLISAIRLVASGGIYIPVKRCKKAHPNCSPKSITNLPSAWTHSDSPIDKSMC